VVDNRSTDNSLTGIDALGVPVRLIRNSDNLGFAAACNQGAWNTSSDYLLFLNPDTKLFKNSFSVPIAVMEQPSNQTVGICGIRLIDKFGEANRHCARFPTPLSLAVTSTGLDKMMPSAGLGHFMTEWDHLSTQVVDHVIGAFYLVRRKVFNELHGFDETFFVYLEDLDFSFRARARGWLSLYLADACVFHAGGGTSRQVKAERLFYSLRSRLLYAFKHFSALGAWLVFATTLVLEPVTRTIFALARGAWADVGHTARGYRMLLGHLPSVLRVARGSVRSFSAAHRPDGKAPRAGDRR
jgi:hypothetical protein